MKVEQQWGWTPGESIFTTYLQKNMMKLDMLCAYMSREALTTSQSMFFNFLLPPKPCALPPLLPASLWFPQSHNIFMASPNYSPLAEWLKIILRQKSRNHLFQSSNHAKMPILFSKGGIAYFRRPHTLPDRVVKG